MQGCTSQPVAVPMEALARLRQAARGKLAPAGNLTLSALANLKRNRGRCCCCPDSVRSQNRHTGGPMRYGFNVGLSPGPEHRPPERCTASSLTGPPLLADHLPHQRPHSSPATHRKSRGPVGHVFSSEEVRSHAKPTHQVAPCGPPSQPDQWLSRWIRARASCRINGVGTERRAEFGRRDGGRERSR